MMRLYKILFKIVSFFNRLRGLFSYIHIFPHKRIKLKLKDIVTVHGALRFTDRKGQGIYPWERLKRHIKWLGLIRPLIVKEVITDDSHYTEPIKYILHDGNHRYTILHELYGEDYEVKCKVLQIPSTLKINHIPTHNSDKDKKYNLLSANDKIFYHSKVITDNPKVYETLNGINDLKNKMMKEAEERKMKLMQKYRINVRVNTKN